MSITRRGLLLGSVAVLGAGAGAGVGASLYACRTDARAQATLDPARLRAALGDIVAPERIGMAYRSGRDRAALAAELSARPDLMEAAASGCPATLRARLRGVAREEFRRGDVVLADRFVMARSECILAALAT